MRSSNSNMNARRLKRTGLEYLDNIDLKFRKKHTTAMMQFWGVLRMLIPVLWLSTIALQIGKALLHAGTANNAFPICRAIILSHRTGINIRNTPKLHHSSGALFAKFQVYIIKVV